MSKQELTQWFSMATHRPRKPGIYNVSCRQENQSGRWYAHFDGDRWSSWETIARAGGWRKLVIEVSRSDFRVSGEESFSGKATWRGLAHPPKGNT